VESQVAALAERYGPARAVVWAEKDAEVAAVVLVAQVVDPYCSSEKVRARSAIKACGPCIERNF
jgi:hypothetical protein